jgi:hypothetical protein
MEYHHDDTTDTTKNRRRYEKKSLEELLEENLSDSDGQTDGLSIFSGRRARRVVVVNPQKKQNHNGAACWIAVAIARAPSRQT